MKKFIMAAAMFLGIVAPFSVFSQQSPAASSLLWEISGNGLKTPSYLYGTYHILCEADFRIKEKTKQAFARASRIVMEVNLTDTSEMAATIRMAMSPDKKLSQQIAPDQARLLDSLLTARFSLPLAKVDQFTPAGLLSIIVYKAAGCPNIKMPDMELMKMAGIAGKKTGGLEMVADQMEVLNKITDIPTLFQYLQDADTYLAYSREMVNAYKTEDLHTLDQLLRNRKYMTVAAEELILDVRNRNWVEKMPGLMEKESVFFAVGAGHLSGNNGVISLLQHKGYNVKPITR